MFGEYYKNKKILVTGHTGFKGAWLTIWLKELGADVVGYSLDSLYENGLYNLSNISDSIIDHREDLRDFSKLLDKYESKIIEIDPSHIHKFVKVSNYMKKKAMNIQEMFE